MPEYDPKSIPILDDIIEADAENSAEDTARKEKAGKNPGDFSANTLSADVEQTEDNLDLFAKHSDEKPTGIAIDAAKDTSTQAIEPEIGAISEITLDTADSAVSIEPGDDIIDEALVAESALIDYQTDEETWPGADLPSTDEAALKETAFNEPAFDKPAVDKQEESGLFAEPQAVIAITEAATEAITASASQQYSQQELENIVNDVVKQLMPDMEQQLRFLIQQALEKRLSDG